MFTFTQNQTVSCTETVWYIDFSLSGENDKFRLLTISQNGISVLEALQNSNRILTVNFGAEGRECIRLNGRLREGENQIRISCLRFKYQLVINGVLADEDWPVTPITLDGCLCRGNVVSAVLTKEKPDNLLPYRVGSIVTTDQLTADGMDCYFGDCMPFSHDGVFHLFYLYDRRRHGSKCKLGGHQWGHLTTTDLVHWKRLPFAVTIDCPEEATFRTGSIIFHNGAYYAFYVAMKTDQSPSRITCSVSTDGEHFEKTNMGFTLDETYENVGVRDPNVFADENGMFHMFLSTKIRRPDGNHIGCILHFISHDLKEWKMDKEPFLTVDMNEYPECSDYFRWNGKYYFSYCIHSVSHYMVSDQPMKGFRSAPEQLLGGNGFVVPKTAEFRGRRIATAFSWTPYYQYAGEPVFLELLQQPDGTLDFRIPEELCGKSAQGKEKK